MSEVARSGGPAPRYRVDGLALEGHNHFVRELLGAAGWTETRRDDWGLLWHHDLPSVEQYRGRADGALVNHFLGIGELAAKDRLFETLAAARASMARRGLTGRYDFFPTSYQMPDDWGALQDAAAAAPDALFIRKPKALSRGRGVELVLDVAGVERGPAWLVQDYLARPHLLDGHKYTLRCYVLVTSLDPLRVYLHADGFTKLTSRPYRRDREHLADRFVHLTNPDVLRADPTAPVSSRNLTHTQYRARLRADGLDDVRLFAEIQRVVAATLIAAREPLLAVAGEHGVDQERCFELLGLDVLVDEDLKPWLLECNMGPSLEVEADPTSDASRLEHQVKRQVVADLLGLTGVLGEGGEPRCGRFEPVYPRTDAPELVDYFAMPRASDLAFARRHGGSAPGARRLVAAGTVHAPHGDGLELHSARRPGPHALNPTASFIWLAVLEGLGPEQIAGELAGLFPGDAGRFEADARGVIAQWLHAGFLEDRAP